MAEIIPAIPAPNYEDLKDKIAMVRGIVPIVQLDICDGVFVKKLTWPFLSTTEHDFDMHFRRILNEEEGLPFWEDIEFELDLMVSDAIENFDIYSKLGPRRMIFHLAAVGEPMMFREFLEGIDLYIRESIEIGVAVLPSASIDDIELIASSVDFIQVMGIEKLGYQGEPLTEEAIEMVASIREKFPSMTISVDGGVTLDNASELIDAGADRLAATSAIFRTDDIIDTIEQFKSL